MAQLSNTQFSVAVHLLTLLAEAQDGDGCELLDSRELAVSPATNPAHARRVLGHLRSAGLVRSQAGAHGGWALSEPADQIDLARVWQAVHGDGPVLGLHTPDINCPVGAKVEESLRALDRRALAALLEELRLETVADVLSEARSLAEIDSRGIDSSESASPAVSPALP